jgi:hypothetical protein
MKYLLIHCLDPSADLSADDDDDDDIDAWDAEMAARGVKLSGGRLRPAAEARTVRVRGGRVLVSDGPFAETKEQIAGFNVIECAGLDEAIEVASRHPTAQIGTFELRPFWSP